MQRKNEKNGYHIDGGLTAQVSEGVSNGVPNGESNTANALFLFNQIRRY